MYSTKFCCDVSFYKKIKGTSRRVDRDDADFGKEVAVDGKIIQSYANKVSTKEPDGRRETQADTTAKN